MITVLAQVTAAPGHESELRAMFTAQVAAVQQAEPRTLAYAIYEVTDAPGTFVFVERYADEAAREAHRLDPAVRADIARLPALTSGASSLQTLELVAEIRR